MKAMATLRKKRRTAALAGLWVLALCAVAAWHPMCAAAADEPVNLALAGNGATVQASSAPNPAWPAAQLTDGRTDTTRGWVGSADQDTQPWVAVQFPAPTRVSSILLYQAGFSEAGEKRFARPKKLKIQMDGVDPKYVTLEDFELRAQKIEFDPVTTSTIIIYIMSTYGDAKFPFLAGFQEIEIYGGSVPLAVSGNENDSDETTDEPETPDTDSSDDPFLNEIRDTITAADAIVESAAENSDGSGAGLDDTERELLILLQEFMDRLEEYLNKN